MRVAPRGTEDYGTSMRYLQFGGDTSGDAMPTKTRPVLAKRIRVTPPALIIITDSGEYRIPWEKCSPRLASATSAERAKAVLSPSGYGIHWPLIDEDLAVGPLIN